MGKALASGTSGHAAADESKHGRHQYTESWDISLVMCCAHKPTACCINAASEPCITAM